MKLVVIYHLNFLSLRNYYPFLKKTGSVDQLLMNIDSWNKQLNLIARLPMNHILSPSHNSSNRKIISEKLLENLLNKAKQVTSHSVMEVIKYKQGSEIYQAGKNARNVFCVKKGLVKLIHPDETGKESMVRLIENSEFFGVLSLIKNYKYTRHAIPIVDSEVYKINREFFMHTMQEDATISFLFSQFLLEIVFAAEIKLNDLMVKTVDQRLAHFLISNFEVVDEELVVSINKKDIALIIGTIQATLSRKLALFASKKYIALDGKKIIIMNLKALQVLCKY